jgi:two-component system LytT family response regulator
MKITVTEGRNTLFLPIENILRMQAERAYTIFYMKDRKQYVITKTLAAVQKQLEHGMFIRVHRQHIINIREVKIFLNARCPKITMSDNAVVSVASRRKTELIKLLKKLK